jgi:anti-anti-sigma regulatory factor
MYWEREMLLLNVYTKGKYHVVNIKQDVQSDTDISDLSSIIRWLLDRSTRLIAIHFTQGSFLDTHAVSHFIDCMEMVLGEGGKLAVIGPNNYIRNFIAAIDFDRTIHIFDDEEELTIEQAVA